MNIFKPSIIVALLTVLSRLSGYVRDILFASFLGTSSLFDILVYALKLPLVFKTVLFDSTFNNAIIPKILKLNEEENNSKELNQFVYQIFSIFLFIAIPIIIIFEIFAEQILFYLAKGFIISHDFELFVFISRIIFPYLMFIVLNSFLTALLNSKFKFALAASIQIIINLFVIISIFISIYYKLNTIIMISISIIFGGFFQTFILSQFVKIDIIHLKLIFKKYKINIIDFFKQYLPSVLISGVITINKLFIFWLATFYLSSVSYLYYADRIFELPHSILSISIATVLLPNIANLIIKNDFKSAILIQQKSFIYTVYFILPISFFLFFFPNIIVELLFERGNFTNYSSEKTSEYLKGLSLGILPYSLSVILVPFFFAIKKLKEIFILSIFIILLNILLTYILTLSYDSEGITYGFSLTTWIFAISIYFIMVKHNFNFIDLKTLLKIIKYLLFSIMLIIFLYFCDIFLSNYLLVEFINYLFIIIIGSLFYLMLTFIFDREISKNILIIFKLTKSHNE